MATVREPDRLTEDEASQHDRMRAVQGHLTPGQRRPRYGQPFWPVTIFGSAMYITATAIALIVLSLIHPADSFYSAPDNGAVIPADPINHTAYNPRPEWYFLFLFQILKYFQGPWEIVGTAVIPGILSVLLLGLPFYDRNWSRRAVRRPIAMASMGLALVLIAFLTYSPIAGSVSPSAAGGDYSSTVLAKPTYANVQAIFAKNCQPCHYNSPYPLGLNLTNYQGVTAGGMGSTGIPKKVIMLGNAKGSYLWQVINWTQKNGANMPLGKPKIPQADRANIANWINNGAKGK